MRLFKRVVLNSWFTPLAMTLGVWMLMPTPQAHAWVQFCNHATAKVEVHLAVPGDTSCKSDCGDSRLRVGWFAVNPGRTHLI